MCVDPHESGFHPRGADQKLPAFPVATVWRLDDDDGHFIGVGQPREVRCERRDVLGDVNDVALVRVLPATLAYNLAYRVSAGDHLLLHHSETGQLRGNRPGTIWFPAPKFATWGMEVVWR